MLTIRIGGLAFAALLLLRPAPAFSEESWRVDERYRKHLLQCLQPTLRSFGGAARIYSHTTCRAGGQASIGDPRLKTKPADKHVRGLAAVRQVFEDDKRVTVTKDKLLRITIGNVRTDLLQTKIHRLRLTPLQQYNEYEADMALESCEEVKAAMHRLRLEQAVVVLDEGIQEPMPRMPRLPAVLRDITLDQALDRIAKTFACIALYEECVKPDGKRIFAISFAWDLQVSRERLDRIMNQ